MYTTIYISSIIVCLCMIVQYDVTYAKRILVMSNLPSYSHQVSYRGLCLELHKRGHEIVSVTTDPMKNSSLTNYTEIDFHYFYKGLPEYNQICPYNSITEINIKMPLLEVEKVLWDVCYVTTREIFKHPEMKKIYAADSNEHFDAVIVAQGQGLSLNAFAHRFNAPLIGISSTDIFNLHRHISGSSIFPSHYSNWQNNMQLESSMSFWRRLVNFYEVWMHLYYLINVQIPIEDQLTKKYLGQDTPYIEDITKNMSIYFVNKHPAFSYARPEQPNMILYHGFHIAKPPPALPEEIKQYLDNAKEGFIYVSLGTNVHWEHLPTNTFEFFVEAFSTLPYKIVWKCNTDLLPKRYKNILASKWFPQQSILAHRNIKLFIYQGGLQSSEEALYYGVPVVGFPIIWDQKYQVQNMVRLGAGVYLQRQTVSKENILAAVYEVVNNKRYKDRMKYLSELYKDVPQDSLQNAVWWVEYVMRHNGASSLRNTISDEPWYQRYDWDIIAFLAIITFIAFFISLYALYRILLFILGRIFCHNNSQYYYNKLKKQ